MPAKLNVDTIITKLAPLEIDIIEYKGAHNKESKFLCKKCNSIFQTRYTDLINNKCQPCKCGKKHKKFYILQNMSIKKQKIGKLLPIQCAGRGSHNRYKWLFLCDCGKEKEYYILDVLRKDKRGATSCGCTQQKIGSNNCSWTGYEEIPGSFFSRFKRGAKNRNLIFDLSIKEVWDLFIKQNRKCALTGVCLTFGSHIYGSITASLDRIDSSKGYTIDNVQWVHKDVNIMKMDATQEEFIIMANQIAKLHPRNIES